MTSERLPPEAERLATSRASLLGRTRWLAPNSRRRRELAAEIRRLAHEELKLEVVPPRSAEAAASAAAGGGEEELRPRFWWVGDDR